MDNTAEQKNYSLRQRYLFASATITLLLLCFAWLAQHHIGDYSEKHRAGMQLRTEATHHVSLLRGNVLRLEQKLNDYLWHPSAKKHQVLHHQIDSTLAAFNQLNNHPWLQQLRKETQQGDFGVDIQTLQITLSQIFTKIDDEKSRNAAIDASEFHQRIQPLLQHLWEYLGRLENELRFHAGSDAGDLGRVAATTTSSIWLLVAVGLSLAAIGFIYFERGVLKPIAMVAHALKAEADGATFIKLPHAHSRETQQLIDAFAEMRRQVQERQQALERQALHDNLTTLPNRLNWQRTLRKACRDAGKEGYTLAVLLIGLDRFKEINDTLGHDTGDKVLQLFAERLLYLSRDSSFIARLGSDEFAILLPAAGQEEAVYVARKIIREMDHPLQVDELHLYLGCSIGITLYPKSSGNAEALTRHADIAMYTAKRHKSGFAIYDRAFNTNSKHKLSLATDLREALQGDGLYLAFQPQLSVRTRTTCGMEVLLRWEHPQHGQVSPEQFIPIAEQTGLIQPLTVWVVEKTFEQMAAWRKQGLDTTLIALNISVFNLQSVEFIDMLKEQLLHWDIPPQSVMLEITETAMMLDPARASMTLSQLDALVVKLAIDDFGTGFSSLAYLKQLPVHELKIDKSFVMEMDTDENDAVIVRSTIDMAHNLGLKVVAEGVETQAVRDLLEILNCDVIQGYLLSRPVPADEAAKWLTPLDREGKVHHIMDYR